MKKLLLLLPLALLCGCAREPSPVSALALDRAGNGCRLTAELVRQDTPEDAAVPSCLAAQGDSFTDALHALEGLLPGELYLSHAQVLLLSEQAAEDDLTPLAEYLCRDNDIRLNLRCAVVRGGAASDLLENDEEIYALSDLLDRAAETGTLPDMPLYRVTEALETDGTAILPSLSLDRFGQTAPSGTAVFTEGKLSCFLDGGMIGGERFACARSALSARVLALAHEQLSPRDRVYARAAVGALSRADALRPCARAERTERLRDVGAACGVSGRGGRGAVRRADRR